MYYSFNGNIKTIILIIKVTALWDVHFRDILHLDSYENIFTSIVADVLMHQVVMLISSHPHIANKFRYQKQQAIFLTLRRTYVYFLYDSYIRPCIKSPWRSYIRIYIVLHKTLSLKRDIPNCTFY